MKLGNIFISKKKVILFVISLGSVNSCCFVSRCKKSVCVLFCTDDLQKIHIYRARVFETVRGRNFILFEPTHTHTHVQTKCVYSWR